MIDRKNFDLADAVILLEIYFNGKAEGKTLHEMAQQASEWIFCDYRNENRILNLFNYYRTTGFRESIR